MTRKEFIKKFRLARGNKVTVKCGRESKERVLYTDPHGNNFVFWGNDLYSVRMSGRRENLGYLEAGYGWYH